MVGTGLCSVSWHVRLSQHPGAVSRCCAFLNVRSWNSLSIGPPTFPLLCQVSGLALPFPLKAASSWGSPAAVVSHPLHELVFAREGRAGLGILELPLPSPQTETRKHVGTPWILALTFLRMKK